MVKMIKKFNTVVINLTKQIKVKDHIIDNLEVDKEILMNRIEKRSLYKTYIENRELVQSLKEEISELKSNNVVCETCIENRELTISLKREVLSLESDKSMLKSKNSKLGIENTTLCDNVKILSSSDAEKKESLRKELVVEKIAQEREHFKRFVPPKKGLGYVDEFSNKG